MRHSTADQRVPTPTEPGCGLPPLVHRPQGPDERSTTFAHRPRSRSRRPDPARRWLPATRTAAWPCRSHRRFHRRADPPLHDCARARRAPAGPLQDAPRLPLRALRRGLPRRYLPTHPGRADGRQGCSRRGRQSSVCVRHPGCPIVRPPPRPPRARRPGMACRPRRNGQICPHGVRLSCNEKHARDDDRLGEPLCPECYNYTGSVLFYAYAPGLWRRFTITLGRTLARRAGLTNKAFATQVRLSYAKVAEYQRRGVVHFHAIVRLDGPAGPATAPARLGHARPAHRRHRPSRPRRPGTDSRRRPGSSPPGP